MKNVYIPKGYVERNANQELVDPDVIFLVVMEFFGINKKDLINKSRKKIIVYPRQVCQWFLWHYTNWPEKRIGEEFNQKDHTSVTHSREIIQNYMDTDANVKKQIEEIGQKIKLCQ